MGNDSIVLQDSFGANGNSISPQISSKYHGGWGNLVKICDGMVYYSVLVIAYDESTVVYKCLEFGRILCRNSWAEVECFWKKRLVNLSR